MIRAYITITIDITLMKRTTKNDSESDCKIERNTKKDITSDRNVVVSINTLQSLITSAPKYVRNQIALLKME